jgi:IS30 family transposase
LSHPLELIYSDV